MQEQSNYCIQAFYRVTAKILILFFNEERSFIKQKTHKLSLETGTLKVLTVPKAHCSTPVLL